jgi:hypothetical protein
MIPPLAPASNRPRLRDAVPPAHERYGCEPSARTGPPVPAYVPPADPDPVSAVIELRARVAALERRADLADVDLADLARVVACLEGPRP